MSLAYYLFQKGFSDITILEKAKQTGGLANNFSIENQPLELFYHHFFKNDTHLIDLMTEIGLEKNIKWIPAKMGLFLNNRLLNFSTALDIVKFPEISFFNRIRMGLVSLYLQKKKSPKGMLDRTALDWCRKYYGKEVTNKMWEPLLISKFGKFHKEVSMAWLWARLHDRASSRTSPFKDELLGYPEGSYKLIVNKLEEKLKEKGCKFIFDANIFEHRKKTAEYSGTNRKTKHTLSYTQSGENKLTSEEFDAVVSTMPPHIFARIFKLPEIYANKLRSIKSLGVTCLILETDKQFSGYYWTTVNDPVFPFLAVVEHTNLIGSEKFNGRHILYLPKYQETTDELFLMPKDDLIEKYIPYLKKINPGFDHSRILKSHLFKADYAQHIANTDYPMLTYKTGIDGLYYANFCQIFPHDRGISHAIEQAKELADLIEKETKN